MSASRAAILDRLRDQPEALTQAALVAATGLHPNTVREHLEGLLRRGLVHRFKAEPAGRGRPAWLYEATAGPGSGEYAGLAAALAGGERVRRSRPQPRWSFRSRRVCCGARSGSPVHPCTFAERVHTGPVVARPVATCGRAH
jgi:DNA-binding transcriptional ArsR family regulator